jgi:hypothetical protein
MYFSLMSHFTSFIEAVFSQLMKGIGGMSRNKTRTAEAMVEVRDGLKANSFVAKFDY